MSFFMRSLLRTVPLIGALLISAVPTKAQELDLANVCASSVEAATVCGASYYHGTLIVLCSLEKNGYVSSEIKNGIIQEISRLGSNEEYKLNALSAAIKLDRSQEPDCTIRFGLNSLNLPNIKPCETHSTHRYATHLNCTSSSLSDT